jgi:hypothetical protein
MFWSEQWSNEAKINALKPNLLKTLYFNGG